MHPHRNLDSRQCPECGAVRDPFDVTCARCGAELPTVHDDALFDDLEDLKSAASELPSAEPFHEAAPAEVEAVERTLTELEAIQDEAAVTGEGAEEADREGDLREFARGARERLGGNAWEPSPLPGKSPASSTLFLVGGVVAVGGLFLISQRVSVGMLSLLGGVATIFLGVAFRFAPHAR